MRDNSLAIFLPTVSRPGTSFMDPDGMFSALGRSFARDSAAISGLPKFFEVGGNAFYIPGAAFETGRDESDIARKKFQLRGTSFNFLELRGNLFSTRRARLVVMIGAFLLGSACRDATGTGGGVACDPDNGGLSLPPGFCALVVARGLGPARHIAVRPNGDLYVAVNNSAAGPGGVIALRDTDGDGRADLEERFGPTGGNGIAWQGNSLFFAPDDRVLRYDFAGSTLTPSGGPVTVVLGLPANSIGEHDRKTVVLDHSGGLLVNIGSSSDACQEMNRIPLSPGIFPCPELATRAGIWRFSATRTGQTQGDGVRFAGELRNMNALAVDPRDGVLYGVQNGRDFLSLYWPTLFDSQQHALLPAEELFRIEAGRLYGWPYCYFDGIKNLKVLNPEYGGNGSEVGMCQNREKPITAYPAHWAPLSMLFYTGSQFPADYSGGLFIAFHGSQPTPPAPGAGFLVTFVPWRNGQPLGSYRVFADGFAGGNLTVAGAAHRPVGLAQGPRGEIYVSDDKAGWVWRISYVGISR